MASPLTAINVSDNLNSSATRTKSKQLNQEFALPWDSIHRDQVDDHVTKAHQRDDLSKSNIGAVSEYSISHRPEKSKHHVCIICTRAFSRLEHLTRHVLSHTKEKPFPCETCGRYFARRDLVLRHRQKVHILLTSIESHTASKGINKKRVGQLTSKEDGSVYIPTEGTRVTDWCAVSNEKCHADISTFASVLPEKKPADNHDSMFHNLANTNIHEDLDTAAMLRPRKDHIVLNPLQEGNQGTTPSFDDSDKEADPLFLDHLFLDHYATLNSPLHPPDEASQSLILDNAASLSNHDAHGKFADGGITGDASDSNWAKDFHAGMITETEEETAAAGAYGEVLLGTFSNDTPTSQQRRQPTQSLQTETDVSSLMNMDFQTFEDPAAYTGSIHAGTLPCHHHVFDPKFPTFPSLSFESAVEMGSTKSDGRTSDNTTPPSPPPPPPPENKYAVILKIRYGSKVHSTLLKLRENTRSCIERQAKEYIWANFLQPHVSPGRRWTSRLLSVVVKEDETDISGYEDDDLTFLLEFNSQHNVSQFTVKVDYTSV